MCTSAFINYTPAKWAAAVHWVLLSKPSKARFAEDVAARLHLERFMEQIQADWADDIFGQGVQLRLRLKKFSQLGVPPLLQPLCLSLRPSSVCAISPPPLPPQLLFLLLRLDQKTFISGGGLPACLSMIRFCVGFVFARLVLRLHRAAAASTRIHLLNAASSPRCFNIARSL